MGAGPGAAIGLVMVLGCLLFAIPLGLAIGSVILRGGVSLANKIRGAKPGTRRRARSRDYDDDDDRYDEDDDRDDRDRYDRFDDGGEVEPIPEPSLGWGMLIILVAGAVNAMFGFAIGLGVEAAMAPKTPQQMQVSQLIANGISAPIGFLSLSGFCAVMLPTTFPRAMLATLMYYVICIAIGIVIVGIAFGAIMAMGGLK